MSFARNMSRIAWHCRPSMFQPSPFSSRLLSQLRHSAKPNVTLGLGIGLTATYTGLEAFRKPALSCEPLATPSTIPSTNATPITEEEIVLPQSKVNMASLGFGTAAGICAGVFVAKGLRALAFLLGGLFVFLQYTSGQSWTKVNWNRMEDSYDRAMGTLAGAQPGNRLARLWSRLTDFLMADFPQRSTFVAGFILGLRVA